LYEGVRASDDDLGLDRLYLAVGGDPGAQIFSSDNTDGHLRRIN
jgi:hypothetical protein